MKFGDMVHFDRRVIEVSNAQTNNQKIQVYVEQHPGASLRAIATALWPDLAEAQQKASSYLSYMLKRNQLSRKRQDGLFRYYPATTIKSFFRCPECDKELSTKLALNGHITGKHRQKKAKLPMLIASETGIRAIEPVVEPVVEPSDLEQAAKDFYWETSSDSLREFVEWRKK